MAWRGGDAAALSRLMPLVERELHRIAKRCMAGERAGHTLQATTLVNEAYLRLINTQQVDWQNRAHFLAMAARLMRRVLVDSARARHYQKRGGAGVKVTFNEGALPARGSSFDVVALDAREDRPAPEPGDRVAIFGGPWKKRRQCWMCRLRP